MLISSDSEEDISIPTAAPRPQWNPVISKTDPSYFTEQQQISPLN